MSAKIDQSLDEILTTQRAANRGRGRPRRGRAAPVGGIRKSTRVPAKPAGKAATKAEATASAVSTIPAGVKVVVSNLPHDVTEDQVKEYFTKSAGPIKVVRMTYGAKGQPVGIATIIFRNKAGALKAFEANGTKVDNKPMRIEMMFDPSQATAAESKSLVDRVTNNKLKAEPKQARAAKPAEAAVRGGRGRGGRAVRGGRGGRKMNRPKPKTADELDADMTDYFGPNNGDATANAATTNGAVAPAAAPAGGDEAMDEIS